MFTIRAAAGHDVPAQCFGILGGFACRPAQRGIDAGVSGAADGLSVQAVLAKAVFEVTGENAVMHGLHEVGSETLSITGRREDGRLLFAVEDVSQLGGYLAAMFGLNRAGFAAPEVGYWLGNYGVLLVVLAVCSTPLLRKLYGRLPAKATAAATPVLLTVILIACAAYVVDASYNPFLYFRF